MATWKARLSGSILVALAIVAMAEGATRVAASSLREPLLWHSWEAQNKVARMDRLADKGARAQVVFVGSSMVNVAVDACRVDVALGPGASAYNAALNASDARMIERWTLEVVVPRLRPQIVVIGLSSRELNDRGRLQQAEFQRFASAPAGSAAMGNDGFVDRLEAKAARASSLFRYRTVLRRPLDMFDTPPAAAASTSNRCGQLDALVMFRDARYHNEPSFVRRTRREDLVDFTIGGRQVEALERLIDGLRARGIMPVLMKMPVTEDAIEMHPRGFADYDRFERLIENLAGRWGVRLVDVAGEFTGEELFFNALHLDGEGQEAFTSRLIGELAGL